MLPCLLAGLYCGEDDLNEHISGPCHLLMLPTPPSFSLSAVAAPFFERPPCCFNGTTRSDLRLEFARHRSIGHDLCFRRGAASRLMRGIDWKPSGRSSRILLEGNYFTTGVVDLHTLSIILIPPWLISVQRE